MGGSPGRFPRRTPSPGEEQKGRTAMSLPPQRAITRRELFAICIQAAIGRLYMPLYLPYHGGRADHLNASALRR